MDAEAHHRLAIRTEFLHFECVQAGSPCAGIHFGLQMRNSQPRQRHPFSPANQWPTASSKECRICFHPYKSIFYELASDRIVEPSIHKIWRPVKLENQSCLRGENTMLTIPARGHFNMIKHRINTLDLTQANKVTNNCSISCFVRGACPGDKFGHSKPDPKAAELSGRQRCRNPLGASQ